MSTENAALKQTATIINLEVKPKLIISRKLEQQIYTLQKTAPEGIEWSGLLIYKTLENNFEALIDNKPWVIMAEEVVPMDVGTSSYTEYEINPEDEYSFDILTDALTEGKKIGHIHEHHNMGK